jgi:hypothetical protein
VVEVVELDTAVAQPARADVDNAITAKNANFFI